jgi:hypothetical protein
MFKNLKLGMRLGLGFSVAIFFLIVNGVVSVSSLESTNQGLTTVYNDRVVPLKGLKSIADAYAVDVIDAVNKANAGLLSAESAFAAQPQAAFARQVRALGQLGDVLLMLSVTGDEPALLAALEAAHERELMVLLLTGRSGGALAQRLRETDVLIAVPHDRPARVREVHTLVLHCLCDGIDAQLLGEEESS